MEKNVQHLNIFLYYILWLCHTIRPPTKLAGLPQKTPRHLTFNFEFLWFGFQWGRGGGGKNAEAWNASGINWPVAPGEHKITNHTARKKVKWSLKKVWFSFFLDSFVDLTQAAFLLKTILYRPIPLISVLFGLYFSFYSSLIHI